MKKLLEIPLSILLVLGIAAASTGQGFTYSTLCGDDRPDCAYFFDDEAVLNELQGLIQENITVTNEGNITDTYIQYETALGLDCTGILSVQEKIDDGDWFDASESVLYGQGDKENCILSLPVQLNESTSHIYFTIVMDNFPKWEVERAKDLVNEMNGTLTSLCEQVGRDHGLEFYITPIDNDVSETFDDLSSEVVYCYRVMDDLYYFYENYYGSQEDMDIGEYESHLSESRFYLDAINVHMGFLQKSLLLNSQETILDKLGVTGGMKVFGTEYQPGDMAKVFLQLVNGEIAAGNTSCYVTIYWPNSSILVNNQPMLFAGSNGLFYYNIVTPNVTGVYMTTAKCYVGSIQHWYSYPNEYPYLHDVMPNVTLTTGTEFGSYLNLNDPLDGMYYEVDAASKIVDFSITIDTSYTDKSNISEIAVFYAGVSDSNPTATFYLWDYNAGAWKALSNTLTYKATTPTSGKPTGIDEGVVNTVTQNISYFYSGNTMRIRMYATSGNTFKTFNDFFGLRLTYDAGIKPQELKGGSEIHVTDTQAQTLSLVQNVWSWLTTTLWAKLLSMETQIQEAKSLSNLTLWYANNTYLLFNQSDLLLRQVNITLNQVKDTVIQMNYTVAQIKNDTVTIITLIDGKLDNISLVKNDTASIIRILGNLNTSVNVTVLLNNTVVVNNTDIFNAIQQLNGILGLIKNDTSYIVTKLDNLSLSIADAVWANRSGQLWIGGTEYSTLEPVGRIVARILDGGNNPVNGALCNITIFLPTGVNIYKNDIMSLPPSQSNGIYYYDFNHSGQVGVHTYTIDCNKAGQRYFLMGTYHVFNNNASLIAEAVWNYGNKTVSLAPNQTVGLDPNSTTVEQLLTRLVFTGATEYYPGDHGMLVTQFFRGANPLDNKSVSVKVFYPDMSTYIASMPMVFKESGIYYYNFTAPFVLGVYTASAQVTEAGQTYYASHTFHVNKGLKAVVAKG